MISGGSPIPTRKPFPGTMMPDPAHGKAAPAAPSGPPAAALPAELEARITAFETTVAACDFDGASWFWMILWGIAIPVGLLAVGWWA